MSSAILNILKNFEKDMGLDAHEKAIQKIDEEERKEIEEISEREADYVTRCPECGEIIDVTGGCYTCRSCGFSKCE